MTLKNCPCTAVGIAAGIAVVVGGIMADMLMGKSSVNMPNSCTIRQKASRAMHSLGDCLDRAADNIQSC